MSPKTAILTTALGALIWSGASMAAVFGNAASVNGEVIPMARLQASVDAQLARDGMNIGAVRDPGIITNKRRQVLDTLIGQALLWQAAERQGVEVAAERVQAEFERREEGYRNEIAFEAALEDGGFTRESYLEEIERELAVRALIRERIVEQVEISDAEIAQFYEQNRERMRRPEQVRARHILLKIPADDAQGAKTQARIESLREALSEGADFAELARKHSQGPTAERGGDLGFFGRGRMVKPFEEAAFALKAGELSGAVRTQYGMHLIRLEARRGGDLVPREQVAERIAAHLRKNRIQEQVARYVHQLRERAEIEILMPQ